MKRTALALVALLLFAAARAEAAEPVPGNSCTTLNQWQSSGGPENAGIVNGMFCNGSTWQGVINFQSTGTVGIGTTSPETPLTVASNNNSGFAPTLRLINLGGGYGSQVAIDLDTYDTGAAYQPTSRIISTDVGSYTNNIDFQTNLPGTNPPSLKSYLEIQGSNGNVVIDPLALNSGTTANFLTMGGGGEGMGSNRANASVGMNQYGLDFYTNSVNRMAISNGGRVGIGTAAPAYALDVSNATSGSNAPFLRLGNSGGGAGNLVGIILSPWTGRSGGVGDQIIAIDDGNSSAHMLFYTASPGAATTSTERMRITDAGLVGIGTTSPQATLDVSGFARLKMNSSAPATCAAANEGSIALTHLAQVCVCDTANVWHVLNTATACSW